MRSLRLILGGGVASAALAFTVVASPTLAVATPTTTAAPAADTVGRACVTQREAVKASATVATLRALGDCQIDGRLDTLAKLGTAVDASKVMTADHKAALKSELSATTSGIKALKSTIDAETSIPALRADIKKIVFDYRVYVLVARQVHLVNAADRVAAIGQKFDTIDTKLQALISKAEAKGKDVTKAKADLAAMNAAVDQATSLAAPIPGEILPLTPAQYNAGTARPVLDAARTDLLKARDLLRIARDDAKAVVADLK